MEVEYFADNLLKNQKKLQQSVDFLSVAKKLPSNTILSQIQYINHILDLALEVENLPLNVQKSEILSKIETSACQVSIESLSLSDEAFSINNSINNVNSIPSGVSSFIKSPSLRLKNNEKTSITPIKSRSNSRESIIFDQPLEGSPLEVRSFKKKFQSSTAIQVS